MASITKRGDGYSIRWRDLSGHAHARQAPDLTTARRLGRDIERSLAEGRDWRPTPARQGPDLREVMAAYLGESARTHSPGTTRRYGEVLELFAQWVEEREHSRWAPAADILSRQLLGEYYTHLLGSGRNGGRTRSTARKHIEAIQVCWAWAHEHDEERGWLDGIPRPRRLAMPRRERPVATAPTWAEMDLVLQELDGWMYRLAVLQRATGSRLGETLQLEWDDVDLEARTIRWRPETTKGGYGGRVVPIPGHLAAELATWGVRQGRVVGAPEKELTSRGRAGRNLLRAWARAGVRESVWKGHPTHALRKGFYSGLLGAGVDRDSVDLLVGHAIAAVRAAYLDPEVALRLRDAVERVPAPSAVTSLDARRRGRRNG